MAFKDRILLDRDVFVNQDEFAAQHTINGIPVPVVLDNDHLQHRTQVEFDGLVIGDLLFFVRTEDMPFEPKTDQAITFDGIPCQISDRREDNGLYEIILKKNVR